MAQLKTCLLDGKEIIWRHPFKHFHVGGIHTTINELPFADIIQKGAVQLEFLEGPIAANLFGADFELYSHTKMKDFIITNIDWKNESKEEAEVYVTDGPDKTWSLTRLYITKKEAEEYSSNAVIQNKH